MSKPVLKEPEFATKSEAFEGLKRLRASAAAAEDAWDQTWREIEAFPERFRSFLFNLSNGSPAFSANRHSDAEKLMKLGLSHGIATPAVLAMWKELGELQDRYETQKAKATTLANQLGEAVAVIGRNFDGDRWAEREVIIKKIASGLREYCSEVEAIKLAESCEAARNAACKIGIWRRQTGPVDQARALIKELQNFGWDSEGTASKS